MAYTPLELIALLGHDEVHLVAGHRAVRLPRFIRLVMLQEARMYALSKGLPIPPHVSFQKGGGDETP